MRKCRSEALEEVGRGGLGIGTGGNRTGSVARGTSDVNHVGVVEGETGVVGQHATQFERRYFAQRPRGWTRRKR